MSRIDELIAAQRRRMEFFNEEIDRLEKAEPGKHVTKKDHEKWIAGFEQDRRDLRDTIAYLEAFKKHGVKP